MSKLDRIDPAQLAHNPRATVTQWLRFQPVVVAAFRQHPRPFTYVPKSMSPATVASRMRDAIRGAICFSYPSDIPITDLAQWWEHSSIRHTTKEVVIGPITSDVLPALECLNTPSPTGFHFDSLSFEELVAFSLLLDSGRIVGPVVVDSPPDISLLPPRNNVEVLHRGTQLVLL